VTQLANPLGADDAVAAPVDAFSLPQDAGVGERIGGPPGTEVLIVATAEKLLTAPQLAQCCQQLSSLGTPPSLPDELRVMLELTHRGVAERVSKDRGPSGPRAWPRTPHEQYWNHVQKVLDPHFDALRGVALSNRVPP
jgi:hypothetical protein